MAEFSEVEVQKFKAVREAMGIGKKTLMDSLNAIDAELPDPEELKRFLNWTSALAKADRDFRNGPDMTAKEFVQEADSVNFLQSRATDRLVASMQKNFQNPIPIGFESDVVYRLVPDAFRLLPHLRPKNDWEEDEDVVADATGRPLLPPSFLGINTTVQPREPAVPINRRKANLSEVSTQSAESDDADSPGFAFFQLGGLEYAWREDEEQGWPADNGREEYEGAGLSWDPTGFNLVARLSPSGHADGIYAVYDMFQDDMPASDERLLITHPAWGIPPTGYASGGNASGDQFSCARIGNRLSDFGKDHQMVWKDKIEHPVELVRVLRSTEGRVLRATVDERAPWAGLKEGSSGSETGSDE